MLIGLHVSDEEGFSCDSRPGWRALKRESNGCCEDLLILFPWLGDACDATHGLEALSAHDGEAGHTGADPSDVQHREPRSPTGCDGKLSRCARGFVRRAGGTHIRFPHSRGHGTLQLAPLVTPYEVTRAQWKPETLANSTASKSQCV